MYGGGYNSNVNQELASDMWIQRNIPGGLNSPLGEALDNISGGNPNPTYGQIVGGAPGVGGYNTNVNQELASDMWIQRNVPGGLNSPLGEALDNMSGGNPNPTYGQIVGGAPGVGGFGY